VLIILLYHFPKGQDSACAKVAIDPPDSVDPSAEMAAIAIENDALVEGGAVLGCQAGTAVYRSEPGNVARLLVLSH
jgi:hypothetical protein